MPCRTLALRLLAALLATGLIGVLTGCEAPLRPDSEKQPAGSSTSTRASESPAADQGATSTPSPAASATSAPTPSIDVPDLSRLPKTTGTLFGGDVSWPQCPKGMGIPEKRSEGMPMPLSEARFVVIGLTNGPGFVANPCLADQVAYAKQRKLLTSAYSVISGENRLTPPEAGRQGPYDAGTKLGRQGNIGYQQALFNIASMKRAGLSTPLVWLDIEPVRSFDWGADIASNVAVIKGAVKGYTEAGYGIGVYSTPYLYRQIAGDLRLLAPEWRAAGQTSRAEALSRCGDDWVIAGGKGVLGQWVAQSRDLNVTCPGATTRLGDYFHQY